MRPEAPDAHLSPAGSGLAYHRPPRFRPDLQPVKIAVPAEPKKGHGNGMTMLLSALIPMAMGGVMVVRHPAVDVLAVHADVPAHGAGPVARRLGSSAAGRSAARRARTRPRWPRWRPSWSRPGRPTRSSAAKTPWTRRRSCSPRPGRGGGCGSAAPTTPTRCGCGSACSTGPRDRAGPGGRPRTPSRPPCRRRSACPSRCRWPRLGVVGLAGPTPTRPAALARWLVAQAAVLHSPRDLSIVVLSRRPAAAPRTGTGCAGCRTARRAAARTAWRWSAPTRTRRRDRVTRAGRRGHRAAGADAAGRRLAGLGGGPGRQAGGEQRPGPRILVVLDGARSCAGSPACRRCSPPPGGPGSTRSASTSRERVLPEECAAVVSWDIPGRAATTTACTARRWTARTAARAVRPFLIRGSLRRPRPGMLADQVSGWADRVARALAPVRDVSRDDGRRRDPGLGPAARPDPPAGPVAPTWCCWRWQRRGRTTTVPIGIGADGPFIVDLSRGRPARPGRGHHRRRASRSCCRR